MKRLLFIGLAVLTLTACKKDWTCTCQDGDYVNTYTIQNQTKKDAKQICTGAVSVGAVSVGGYSGCTID